MDPSPRNLVLFDFDGVIADSWRLAYSIATECCPGIAEEEFRAIYEGNILDWRRSSLCDPTFDFTAAYVARVIAESTLFPGMREVLADLGGRYTLVIVTSSISAYVRELCERFDIATFFADVLGSEVHKNKTHKMHMAMRSHDVGADECIFVTDTLGDAREAEHAGVSVIGVSWGFHDHATLQKDRALVIADTPADLVQAIDDHFLQVRA